MNRFLLAAVCLVSTLHSEPLAVAQSAAPQAPAPDSTPLAVLAKLSPPVYPPLARQARIMGDVRVQVLVRKDGAIESSEVISGHPMLKQAALESAQKSQFECPGCGDGVTTLFLTYAFEIKDDGDCCTAFSRAPEVTQLANRIWIVAPALCLCDPAVSINPVKIRSLKYLYLWKCGSRSEYPL